MRRFTSGTPEEQKAAYQQLADLEAQPGFHGLPELEDHEDVDLEKDTPDAQGQRAMLGHVEDTLKYLEAQGYDIRKALREAGVSYAPGNTAPDTPGHSFSYPDQEGKEHGYFTIGHRELTKEKIERDMDEAAERWVNKEPPQFSFERSGRNHFTKGTIIHELAHAIGRMPHIDR